MARGNYSIHKVHSWQCAPVLFLIFSLVVSTGTTREVYFEEYSLPSLHLHGEPSVAVLGNKTTQIACAIRCINSESCAGFSCHLTNTNKNGFLCESCYMLSSQNMLKSTENASVIVSSSTTSNRQSIRNFRAFSQSVDHSASPSQAYDVHQGEGLRDGAILYLQGKASWKRFQFAIMEKEWPSSHYDSPRLDLFVHVNMYFDFITYQPLELVLGSRDATGWTRPPVYLPTADFLAKEEDMEWVIFVAEDEYNIFVNGKFVTNYSRTENGFALGQFEYIHLDPLLPRMQWLMP